jgi:glycosyltransferase involved in cell wall biosynthesis
MKILYDHQIFSLQNYGGASRYYYELLKRSDGLFSYDITGLYSENIYSKALNLHKDFPVKAKIRGKQRIIDFINKNNAIKKMKTGNYDMIHSTLYEPYILEKSKKPVVITVHDMIHEKFPEYFGINNIYSENKGNMILGANKINVDSNVTKNDILNIFPQVEDKITVIYLACSINILNSSLEKENYILFTGQRGGYKNFNNFITAIAPLLHKYNLHLLCTGNSFEKSEIAFLKEQGIEDKVSYKFLTEGEMGDIYARAIAFVFPSLYEGFGIPMLEAMSSSCPVIASNRGSLPEIGGEAAVYFDPHSVDNMRAVIENVLTSSTLQNELILKGREQAKKFSWDQCVNETVMVYNKLLKGSQ